MRPWCIVALPETESAFFLWHLGIRAAIATYSGIEGCFMLIVFLLRGGIAL